MIKNVLIIKEQFVGKYECRGEFYHSITVFDLDKLNAISKTLIEDRYFKEWSEKYGEVIEPMNLVDWSFEDFIEEMTSFKENSFFDHRNIETFDLNNEDEKVNFLKELHSFVTDKKHNDPSECHYSTVFMPTFFSDEQIKSCDITDQISISDATLIEANINGSAFSSTVKTESIKLL